MKTDRIKGYFSTIVFLILYVAHISASTQQKVIPLTEQEKADLRYVLSLNPTGQTTALDFSDHAQYRFYLQQIRHAGITPEQAPQFFKVLEEARGLHRAYGPPKLHKLPADVPSGEVEVVNIITELGSVDATAQNWTSAALSSVPDGSTASRMTLVLYDKDFNPIGPTGESSDYEDGRNLPVITTGHFSSPAPAPTPRTVQSVETFFYLKDGRPYHGYTTRLTATYPKEIKNQAPTITVPGHTYIKVCLDRTQFNDCDYYQNTTIRNVQFPIQGSAQFFGTIQPVQYDQHGKPTNAFSYIEVTRPESGGGCPLVDEEAFFINPNTIINGDQLSWNLNPASFGDGAACYRNGDWITFTFSLYVTVVPEGSQEGTPVWVFITNAPDTEPNLNSLVIPDMQLVYGCMAEDTLITMHDGSKMEIQKVIERKKVLQNRHGGILTVEDTTVGFELRPMIRIRDDAKNSLLLTAGHPVISGRGVQLARDLKVGDQVFTQNGATKLIQVSKEQYGRKVWNLNVGMTEDGVTLTKDNTTFFANNILVGDGRMQSTYGALAKRDPNALLERLPLEWHQDYFNDAAARRRSPL